MGVDLVGVDLVGVDLVGVDLVGVDLVGVDLMGGHPLNSEQRTLVSPQRTLANTKLPLKTDSKDNADLVDRFLHATVAGFKDRAL